MSDTHPMIKEKMDEFIMSMSPGQRFMKCVRFYNDALKLTEVAVKRQNPELTGKPLRSEIFRWIYQNELPEETIEAVINRFLRDD